MKSVTASLLFLRGSYDVDSSTPTHRNNKPKHYGKGSPVLTPSDPWEHPVLRSAYVAS